MRKRAWFVRPYGEISSGIMDRTGALIMLCLTYAMISCVDLAQYGVSHVCGLWYKYFLRHKTRYSLVTKLIVYAHGRRLCSNWFRHGSTTISYPQCSLTFLRERYLHRCREQSFAVRAVGIDVVSSHTKYCRIAFGITR